MSLILIIDTSSNNLSLALIENKICIEQYYENEAMQHARAITTQIEALYKKAKKQLFETKYIAIHSGPGSFTGLRVGSSVAKGLCYGLNCRLIALSGITEYAKELLKNLPVGYTDVIVMIDARRQNYYYSHINREGAVVDSAFENFESIEKKIAQCDKPYIYNSNDVEKQILKAEMLMNATYSKIGKGSFEDIALFEPYYLINNYLNK